MGTFGCAQRKMDLWHRVWDLIGQSDPVYLCCTVTHSSLFVAILLSCYTVIILLQMNGFILFVGETKLQHVVYCNLETLS